MTGDDPRATAFAQWLRDAEQWRSAHADLSDLKAACDDAGALIGRLRDILSKSPLLELTGVRQKAEAATTVVDPEWSAEAARQRRELKALKRGILDFGPAYLGPGTTYLAGDLESRASGSPSLLDDKIPRASTYGGGNPKVKAAIKPQTVRLAHWLAGRNESSWRSEHKKICPKLSVDQQDIWNRLIDKAERDDCRRVGGLIRKDVPLSPEDHAIAAAATRWGAAELAELARAYL